MKPIPAIVEPAPVDLDLLERQLAVELAGLRDDERNTERHEREAARHVQMAGATRESARARRLRIGEILAKARGAWPKRGPNAKGWGEFLLRHELDDATARRYMDEHRDPEGFAQKRALSEKSHSASESDHEESQDNDAEPANDASDEPAEVEIDRDTWCTPKWITDAIGEFDLDPCSNERSTVRAVYSYRIERGEDGLKLLTSKWMDPTSPRVYLNPPYSNVLPWVQAFKHTRFAFLLKLDPSTKWFAELYAATELILIPRGTRVQFEPPPGVPPDKAQANQFPHALFYARAEDATDEIRDLCFAWRVERVPTAIVREPDTSSHVD